MQDCPGRGRDAWPFDLTAPSPLLLIGGGGFARETLELIATLNQASPAFEVIGLLDDDPNLHGQQVHGVSVLGGADAVHEHPDALLVATVASPSEPMRRLELVSRLSLPEARFATLLHPTALVPRSTSVGAGTVIHAGTVLTADIRVGAHVAVMPTVVLTHDDVLEEGTTIGAGACLAGGVKIGRGAYVGSGALVREQTVVGPGAVIGMGAVVTQSVPAGEVWAGVPARRLRATKR